jgi:hypothetical protein
VRKVVIAIVIVFFCSTAVLASDPQREPEGFRDLKWGDRIEGREGLALAENSSDGISAYYRRNSDKLLIGKAELEDIIYCCADGRFIGVLIHSSGKNNAESLRGTLNSAFGEPDFDDVSQVLWAFPNAKVFYTRSGDRITIMYVAHKKEADIKREVSERAKNAANDEGVKDL